MSIISKLKVKKQVKRCSRCILPDTYPDIKFDDRGVCSKCCEYDKKLALCN